MNLKEVSGSQTLEKHPIRGLSAFPMPHWVTTTMGRHKRDI